MKKVVFYGRYSSHVQTEQSIEGQLHVCERYAKQNDMEIVAQYIDRAMTGTNDKRPEFQRMIADSERNKFEAVLVYKLDRFARNRYDSALYKKRLRDSGVKVISATENITDTPEGIFVEALIEGMDEFYSAELARKMRRGKEESFRKGRFLGKSAPFGYQIIDHRLVIDEKTAPIALEVFQRYAAGETQNSIRVDLNRRGIPNAAGRVWNKIVISTMLRNQIYVGVYKISTYEGEMPCPAIISPELWDKVQKRIEDSVHRSRMNRTDYEYLLTGKIICGKCGLHICGCSCEKGKYHYYRCWHSGSHHRLHIPADRMHELVRDALHEYLTEEKLDEIAAAAYAEYAREDIPATEHELLKSELADIEKQLQNAVNAVLNGFASDSLKTTMSELENRKKILKENLENICIAPPRLTQEHFRCALELLIEKSRTDDLKELFNAAVNHIIVYDEKIIICINLTDESNTPPLEQILYKVKHDETTMPPELRKAHQANDKAVMLAYGFDYKTMTVSVK